MNIKEIDFSLDYGLVSIDGGEKRSEGCHVSTVIKAIERQQGRLKGRDDIGPENDDKWKDYRIAGFLVERAFREMLTTLPLVKLGELKLNDIYMTPDFVDSKDWVLEEWKCTWRSSGHDIDGGEFWSWWVQIKAYCKAIGTRRARLRVFWINGDYRPRKPKLQAWEVEFTQQELDENWEMILNWARSEGWIPKKDN